MAVEMLLEAGADIETATENGSPALFFAANNPKILEHLLRKGADASKKDGDGNGILDHAFVDKTAIALLLKKYGELT